MASNSSKRSINVPKGYQNQPEGRINIYNQTYIGFVKEVVDKTRMGRLKVWIPEFNPVPTENEEGSDNRSLFTVSYCSPFAGATPVTQLEADNTTDSAQQSYGWWAVPPDVGNEVVVQFINGDPSRGIWIGCMYQQRMNHMVPGLASSESHQDGEEGVDPPTYEYNKRDQEQAESDNPTRPRFDPLHEGLLDQGLYTDSERGPTDASARRDLNDDGKPNVYGYSTPRGNHIYVDDNEENEYIRLRTRGGTQILINETIGYIYMISKKGNSWFEISDEGINAFTTRSFNVRAMEGVNMHSEGNVSVNSVGQTNFSGSSASFQVAKNFDLLVPGMFNVTSMGPINLKSYSTAAISSMGALSVTSGGFIAINAGASVGVSAGGTVHLNGAMVLQNSAPGPAAFPAIDASAPEKQDMTDREVNRDENYPESTTKSIVSALPTHEPWDGHPTSEGVADKIENGESSTGVVADGSSMDPDSESDDDTGEDTPIPENANWIVPCSGTITSLYGMRQHPTTGKRKMHTGMDIGAAKGTPIYAIADGEVTRAGSASGYGQAVYLKHANGWQSEYGHVERIHVRRGQRVTQGQLIATVGSRGVSSGPHLHITMRQNGSHKNPNSQIQGLKGRKGKRVTAKSK